MSNRAAAAELFVTVRTIESTLTKIYSKLGVQSRTQLASHLRATASWRSPALLPYHILWISAFTRAAAPSLPACATSPSSTCRATTSTSRAWPSRPETPRSRQAGLVHP